MSLPLLSLKPVELNLHEPAESHILIGAKELSYKTSNVNAELAEAVRAQDVAKVLELLAAGVAPCGALNVAARVGCSDVLSVLLQDLAKHPTLFLAALTRVDEDKRTPLDAAVAGGHTAAAKLLHDASLAELDKALKAVTDTIRASPAMLGVSPRTRTEEKVLQVFLADGTSKSFNDVGKPTKDSLKEFAERIRLRYPELFSFHVLRKATSHPQVFPSGMQFQSRFARQWLHLDEPVMAQRSFKIGPQEALGLAMQVSFLNAEEIADCPVTLDLVFAQCRKQVIDGWYSALLENDAYSLGALALQGEYAGKTWRDDDEKVAHINKRGLHAYLPAKACKADNVMGVLVAKHSKLVALSATEAKIRYLNRLQKVPGFGIHFFPALVSDRVSDTITTANKFLVGVGPDGLGVYQKEPDGLTGNLKTFFMHEDILTRTCKFASDTFVEITIGVEDSSGLEVEYSFRVSSLNGDDVTFLHMLGRHQLIARKRQESMEKRTNMKEVLKVSAMDGSVHTFAVSETTTRDELFARLCEKVDLETNASFFQLCDMTFGTERWLLPKKPLIMQHISAASQLMVKVRYWIQNPSQLKDPSAIALYFEEVKAAIVNGRTKVSEGEAVELAALHWQALQFKSEGVSIKDIGTNDVRRDIHRYVPAYLREARLTGQKRSTQWWLKQILAACQREILPKEFAMRKYLELCYGMPTFGFSYFDVLDLNGRPAKLGVSCMEIAITSPNTLQMHFSYYLEEVKRWTANVGYLEVSVQRRTSAGEPETLLRIECLESVAVCELLDFHQRLREMAYNDGEAFLSENNVLAVERLLAEESGVALVTSPRRGFLAEAQLDPQAIRVIRVYLDDESQYKSIRIKNCDTTMDVCHTTIVKYMNDFTFGVANSENMGLYEVWTDNGVRRERWLSPTVRPAIVMRRWEQAKKEFKFVVKDASKKVPVRMTIIEDTHEERLTVLLTVQPTDTADDVVHRVRAKLHSKNRLSTDPSKEFGLYEVVTGPSGEVEERALPPLAYALDYVSNWMDGSQHLYILKEIPLRGESAARALTIKYNLETDVGSITAAEKTLLIRPAHTTAQVMDMAMQKFFLTHETSYDLMITCPPHMTKHLIVPQGDFVTVIETMGLGSWKDGADPPTLLLAESRESHEKFKERTWADPAWIADKTAPQAGPDVGWGLLAPPAAGLGGDNRRDKRRNRGRNRGGGGGGGAHGRSKSTAAFPRELDAKDVLRAAQSEDAAVIAEYERTKVSKVKFAANVTLVDLDGTEESVQMHQNDWG